MEFIFNLSIIVALSSFYGFMMKLSDMLSIEHGLILNNSRIWNFILKIIISIAVGVSWVGLLSLNEYIGYILFFYIISFLSRSKIDDFNHSITFIIIIIGIIYKYSSHPIQFSPLYIIILFLFLFWPIIYGKFFHDKKIRSMINKGIRRDIKNSRSYQKNEEIDVFEVMKSEIPHSILVYIVPSLVFFLVFPILKSEANNLDIMVITSISFFIMGYELSRLLWTILLRNQVLKKTKNN